jgi:hypothetical protein
MAADRMIRAACRHLSEYASQAAVQGGRGRPDPGGRAGHQGYSPGPGATRAGNGAARKRDLVPRVVLPMVSLFCDG